MKLNSDELKVHMGEANAELENGIIDYLLSVGYRMYGCGTGMKTGVRYLVFEKD